ALLRRRGDRPRRVRLARRRARRAPDPARARRQVRVQAGEGCGREGHGRGADADAPPPGSRDQVRQAVNDALRAYLERVKRLDFATAVCGHRGASAQAPENTLAAFRGALQAGCDLVELDVLLTRDEELVVLHDPKLGRTTDRR